MKPIVMALLSMLVMYSLSGCFPTGKRKAELPSELFENVEEITLLAQIPEEIVSYEAEMVHIDARVDVPDSVDKLHILTATGKQFRYEDIQGILSGDETFEQDMNVPDKGTQVFAGSNGGLMTIQPGAVYYISGRSHLKQYNLVLNRGMSLDDRYVNNGIFTKEEIEGFSRQEVIEMARQQLQKIGIDSVGDPKVAALDFETLTKAYENLEGIFPKEHVAFDREDEGYYLVFRCEYKGIPLLAQNYYLRDKALCSGSFIEMIVTRSGIQKLLAKGIYDLQEKEECAETLYDFNRMIAAIKAKYQDIMLQEPVTVNRIELIYAPDVVAVNPMVYELSPCWAVYVNKAYTDGRADAFLYFNALTGDELENET